MATRYESESGVQVDDPSDTQLDQLLGQLGREGNSFASLSMPDGSYIQVGGGPADFTVEVREYQPDGEYSHFKATLPGRNTGERRLTIGGASVSVRSDQILNLEVVRRLFRSFAHGDKTESTVLWPDISTMFQDDAGK
jgi:hypothetical protein